MPSPRVRVAELFISRDPTCMAGSVAVESSSRTSADGQEMIPAHVIDAPLSSTRVQSVVD